MSNPLVVLGAGASYDFVGIDNNTLNHNDINQWKPPLSNELFSPRRFDSILKEFPQVINLASKALTSVPARMSLEEFLTKEKKLKSTTHSEVQKELIALAFYLQELFKKITEVNDLGIDNYNTMIRFLRDNHTSGAGQACLVTFNYDGLIEKHIEEINGNLSSYIDGPIKLIKLHGSFDWVYPIRISNSRSGGYQFLMGNPYFKLTTSEPYPKRVTITKDNILLKDEDGDPVHYFPALSVPVTEKAEVICPETHIKILEQSLSTTDRILIVGWRANDDYLIGKIKELVKQPCSLTVVSSNKQSAEETSQKFQGINDLKVGFSNCDGFTAYLNSGEFENFLENGQSLTQN